MTESESIIDMLLNLTRKHGMTGMPDRLLWFEGKPIGIEYKANGDKLSPAQLRKAAEIREQGGRFFVVSVHELLSEGFAPLSPRQVELQQRGPVKKEVVRLLLLGTLTQSEVARSTKCSRQFVSQVKRELRGVET